VKNIKLDTHYTRSINLERDAHSQDVLNAYIPTLRAMQTLAKIADTFNSQSMPRAWSLIAPYGSGKSSFATFLSHLLEDQELKTCEIAEQLLKRHNPPLADKITAHTNETNAYCIVLLTGSPDSLSKCFIEALYQSVLRYWEETDRPAIVHKIEKARHQHITTTQIINLLKAVQQAVIEKSGLGILIVIDELGKFLEYETRHQGVNDIFLLQAIAEFASQGGKANILLVVLMHQAFEQYAKGLGETQRNEWLKVQGRFENIPFLESSEQTLRVMAVAFSNKLTAEQLQDITQHVTDIISVLVKQNALSTGLTAESACEILSQCYPLHPMAALILPTLCQKVAQNERTLFSYLGSQEAFGFKEGIRRLKHLGEWVLPWEIFQYFIENQPLATTDHITHRRWAEVITAIERLGDAKEVEIQLLKTIGLFNIIGSQAGFKASNELLALCFPDHINVKHLLTQLQKKSIIHYRKFNSEYRIWEGSDFDLDVALQETVQQLGRFQLAEILERRNNTRPVVARKYSIQNATLRYFQPHYVDTATKKDFFDNAEHPRILFFLAENQDDNAAFDQIIKTHDQPLNIYVLCENAAHLKAVIAEVIALEKIQTERAEIKSDRVAQRELKAYFNDIKVKEAELLNHYLEHPEAYQWFWQNTRLPLPNRKELQNQLSTVLTHVYNQAPLIKNELVNRDKISGQANAAKNKLIAALLTKAKEEDLGFEHDKYPAEKTIYRAVFKETEIHVEKNGYWQLVKPPENNKYKLINVWNGIEGFLKGEAPKKLTDLYAFIEKPPYGVQKGVSSLIFIAYYLANQRTLALYENGVFCPLATQEIFEILSKRPELFTVEALDLTGIRADLFNGYFEKLIGEIPEDNTLLDIVKPLAKFIAQLPPYTRSTKSLSPKTIAVRDAFQQTQSPMKLLFEILPTACGYPSYIGTEFHDNNPTEFLNELARHLNSLNNAYKILLKDFQQQLANALEESPDIELANLRVILNKKYAGLEKYSTDTQGLKAFILRLQDNKTTDMAWLESVAAFLGKSPPNKWLQTNRIEAEYRLIDLSERLLRLKTVHPNNSEDSNIAVVRFVGSQDEGKDEIVYLTEELKENARRAVDAINETDKNKNLAIVAEIMSRMR
jgi:hypothetical protein